jgi:dienelactone hydrolase
MKPFSIWIAVLGALTIPTMPLGAAGATGVLALGPGRFEYSADGGSPLTVWTYRDEEQLDDAPVVVVMHGRGRNGEEYRDQWIEPARRYGLTVLVPEFPFDEYPEGTGYQQLGVTDEQGRLLESDQWGPTRVEAIFRWLRDSRAIDSEGYYFYGHSAGGQFVHRAMLVCEMPRAILALPANPGWYTLPDLDTPYPEGLAGVGVDRVRLDRALGRKAVLLLGADDIDPNHESLPRNEAAVRQGPHRLARGRTFHAALTAAARKREIRLGWSVREVPGAAHDNKHMAPHAARLIAEHHLASLSSPSAETPPASSVDE